MKDLISYCFAFPTGAAGLCDGWRDGSRQRPGPARPLSCSSHLVASVGGPKKSTWYQSIFGCNFSFTIWWGIVNRSTNCYYYVALNLRERFPCVCHGLCVWRVTQLEITSLARAVLRHAGVAGCLVSSSGWPLIPPQKQMSANSCEETTDLLFINSYRLKLRCRCC